MSGRYLLDTNIIIAIFADEVTVKENLLQANEVFIPTIAVGELYYGAPKSAQIQTNMAKIAQLVSHTQILVCDVVTAQKYGDIKNKLRLKGRPLPENDVWIAALALQHQLILVTRDAHFQEVENISTIVW